MLLSTLVGLSFGVFPCIMLGFIMLLSLLLCEFMEEYVAKYICSWKNRRRRSLHSFYREFQDSHNHHHPDPHRYNCTSSSRTRRHSPSAPWAVTEGREGEEDAVEYMPEEWGAPPPLHPGNYSGSSRFLRRSSPSAYPMLPPPTNLNDPPPSYEECVLPHMRAQQNSVNPNETGNLDGRKSSRKSSGKHKKSKN